VRSSSLRRFFKGREYIGVVFRESQGRFGFTVRGDGGWSTSTVVVGDVPMGTKPVAVWHTHLSSMARRGSVEAKIVMKILTLDDQDWDKISTADKNLSDTNSKDFGYRIPIYMVTPVAIKRYSGPNRLERVWSKPPPGGMRSMMPRVGWE
jgi:hypothetical protein